MSDLAPQPHPAKLRRGSVAPDVDRGVGDLAGRQHGVASRRQLKALGLSDDAIDARVRRGWLRPVHRGVYAVGHARLEDHGRWQAAVLAAAVRGPGSAAEGAEPKALVTPGALLSHGSAAALHGLLPVRDRSAVEVTTGLPRRPRPGIRFHRSCVLDGAATVRDGIPCTTVGRTLIDLAAIGNVAAFERAWSSAASGRLLRPAAIERELRSSPRRPGTALVRAALAKDVGYLGQRSRSDLERTALRPCRDFGLPRPQANQLLRIGDRAFEADLLWAQPRLIVEIDGDETHGHAAARRRDRERDLALQLAGWRTIRIGRVELTVERSTTVDRLRAALAQPALAAAPPHGSH